MIRLLPTLAVTLLLAACGATYISPTVTGGGADVDVRVVPMTRETVLVANRAPYAPRSLPAYLRQGTGGGQLQGLGGLPTPPQVPDLRPSDIEFRPPPPARNGAYRINAGDVLRLAVRAPSGSSLPAESTESVVQQYTVRDDGGIGIPTVGTVQIGGMTISEAEAQLFQRFLDAGIDPAFSLEVAQYNSARIAVGGDVGRPSILPVSINVPTLDEALIAAGGIEVASPEYASIRIFRDGALYQIPLRVYQNDPALRGQKLQVGDAIFVDSSYDLDRAQAYFTQQLELARLRGQARETALANLQTEIALRRAALDEQRELFAVRTDLDAEERDYVYLAGEVATQSRFALPYDRQASLADVLYGSGGFETETGNPAHIYVLRASTNPAEFGAVTAWNLDASNAANLTIAAAMEMRPDDIVFIEEQPITRWNRALQQVFPSLINVAAGSL